MPPKLMDEVGRALRLHYYSYQTEKAYCQWIRRFILFHRKRHPHGLGAAEIEQYLSYLATERHVAASTQNQALSALLFLGHTNVRTTLVYTHVLKRGGHAVRSPFDSM